MQLFLNATLARARAAELDRRAARRRVALTPRPPRAPAPPRPVEGHTYAPPHVVELPRPIGPGTFDDSVW